MTAKKDIVCPCGRLIRQTTSNAGAGTVVCPSCKKRIRYDITSNKVYTSYVK